jgi:Co/Zn/Cd efflux system component
MHTQSLAPWQHEHTFLGKKHHEHERRTWAVVVLATVMMIAEISGGLLFGSIFL